MNCKENFVCKTSSQRNIYSVGIHYAKKVKWKIIWQKQPILVCSGRCAGYKWFFEHTQHNMRWATLFYYYCVLCIVTYDDKWWFGNYSHGKSGTTTFAHIFFSRGLHSKKNCKAKPLSRRKHVLLEIVKV